MNYEGKNEHLNQTLAEKIFSDYIYDEFYTVDDETDDSITTTINYHLPPNNVDNPLYRTADLFAIAQAIGNIHVLLGGLKTPSHERLKVTERAIDFYYTDPVSFGYVTPISNDRWMLAQTPLTIYGTGRHWIYLYSYKHERDKAKELTQMIPGASYRYPCNIGKTNQAKPEERVYQESKSIPTIELLLRVDDETNFEKVIHSILKLWDNHIPPKDRGGEKEWFNTTPEEVYEIYEKISNW